MKRHDYIDRRASAASLDLGSQLFYPPAAMLGPKLISIASWLVFCAIVVAPAAVRIAVGAEPARSVQATAAPYRGVVLLREGGVLTGAITQAGDRYLVAREGSEINVPAANVDTICHTLEEAYEHRRGTVAQPTADTHLALAEWCLRFELFPQAAQELIAARGLEPRHPKLALLERRLTVVSQPPEEQPAVSGEPSAPASPASPAPTRPAKESQSVADELPDDVVERFTRKIQPLLVNNCTAGGCHRSGGERSFQLDRALLHDMANRRSTRQNLAAVMALVDRERPQESALLTIPRRDHGGMDRPIFGPRQHQQLVQLVEWVKMVAPPAAAANEMAVANANGEPNATPANESLAGPAASPKRWREPVKRVSYDAEGELIDPSQPARSDNIEPTAAKAPAKFDAAAGADAALPRLGSQPLQFGAQLQAWQPKDPFDPEIFNRQSKAAKSNGAPQQ